MDYKKFVECGYHHPTANTLQETLAYTAKNSANGITIHSLNGDVYFLSYKELFEKAKRYANTIKQKNIKGAVLLCIEDSKSFILALWGCLFAGIPAAPLESLRSNEIKEEDYSRLINICRTHKECTIISDDANAEFYNKMTEIMDDPNKQCLSMSELENDSEIDVKKFDENDIAIIQYSSGSTGVPKGAKLTHRNIMYAMGGLVDAFQLSEKTRIAIWSPQFHNLGLFIHIVMIQVGGSIDIFNPISYVQNPTAFFKVVAEKKINIITSNNFGVEWAIKNVDTSGFDENSFSSLLAYIVGSEVVSENTLKRIFEKFGEFGLKKKALKPCYGLTEAVLAGAITFLNDDYTTVKTEEGNTLVGNGRPLSGLEIRIVDDNGNILPEGKAGEIQIKSNAVTSGYIGSDEVCCDAEGWLLTGDIGFLQDGKLYISGRKKEMFIVRGHNYMIHDFEHEITAASGMSDNQIALCADYDPEKKEEVLILFIAAEKSNRLNEVLNMISERLLSKYGFTAEYAVLINSICRTGSGKVDRNALVKKYKSKDYIECVRVVKDFQNTVDCKTDDPNETKRIILKIWSEILGIDAGSIRNDVAFYEYGGDSVKQYQMMELLNRNLGVNLQPSFFRRCRTINEITEGIFSQSYEVQDEEQDSGVLTSEVAVTGFSFKLPQASNNDELWQMLLDKKCVIDKVSEERKKLTDTPEWDNWIGELKGIDLFDADFFDITEKEAKFMDPQQRLILETAYEALEDAAEAFISDEPRNIGVYAALDQQPYLDRIKKYIQENGMDEVPETAMASNLMNIAAARISHFFNFSGAAAALDSACSSFLSALHTARRAIQCGDISAAVVSTAHLIIEKSEFQLAEKAGILSPSGKSKVFDKDADGSVFGEGVISVFIEPLKTAVKNKKHIYAVIKGSAVNNDGYSLSIMAPNSDGQYEVLKRAYADANISPADVSYLEAHGTGTKIGDPIEMHALLKLFGIKRQRKEVEETIGIGSIKSNIGHLLPSASGAGIVKILNCFERKMLVPGANFEAINPALNITRTPFFVIKEPMAWNPENGKSRIACITSLGFGGTNAHMILEEGNNKQPEAGADYYPLIVSAKSREALDKKLSELKDFIKKNPDSLGDICYTSCCGRMSYTYRAACVVDKRNIDDSFENAEYSVYSRIHSLPVCILCGDLPETEARFEQIKQNVDSLIPLIKSLDGIFVGDIYISAKEWKENDTKAVYEKLVSSKSDAANIAVPKRAIKLGVERSDSDICCGLETTVNKKSLMNAANQLYLKGADINWTVFAEFENCGIISLPKYPFYRKSYWV